ncbi:hypothetical protein [Streptacidiphilus sp. MAP12-33]|uniref:hypothetical protein n=1 Tax=Streptacidiphilus sp. MAP12-33 TaxID=3156266 RepID=UPI003516D3FD
MNAEQGQQEPEGGESACWLHRLCPECDAVQDVEHPEHCWRCGAALGDTAGTTEPTGTTDTTGTEQGPALR